MESLSCEHLLEDTEKATLKHSLSLASCSKKKKSLGDSSLGPSLFLSENLSCHFQTNYQEER